MSSPPPVEPESSAAIARDIAAIGRISTVPILLRVICSFTGMGFAAVARVTDQSWTACAVHDEIGFGLAAGGTLDLRTTLCHESRLARQPIVFDHASQDPAFRDHHTPRIYGLESYISVPIVRKGGGYFGNLCAIDRKPMRVSDARTVSMFQLFAELIALQLQNEEQHDATRAALLDAQATAELREHFIAVLGHDLRNPLAAVGASAEVLARRTSEPEAARIGQRLRNVTRRMAGMLDNVMDLARSRMGSGIGVRIEPVSGLGTALREVVSEARDAHPGREVVEAIEIRVTVSCDLGRVQQLLSNLLGNALAHGAPDQAVLVEAVVRDDALAVTVVNGGRPIAPADLERIFRPYWRPSESAPGGGLGLGLYICEQIAQAHGGSMAVSSSLEDGTRFTATLPLSPP